METDFFNIVIVTQKFCIFCNLRGVIIFQLENHLLKHVFLFLHTLLFLEYPELLFLQLIFLFVNFIMNAVY